MTSSGPAPTTLLLIAALSLASAAGAQQPPPAPPPVATPAEPAAPAEPALPPRSDERVRLRREVLRIGQDYTLNAGDTGSEVVVIMGNATIAGRVDGEVVVILGTATLASTAVVERELVVIGGAATIAPGAVVNGDFVVVGGGVDEPPGFSPGGEHVVIGPGLFGIRGDWIVPWLARGFLWGRPIVPELPWVWAMVGVVFFVSLALNQVADPPVRAAAGTLLAKPLTAFGTGLLVLLLVGPACLLLAVSVIGIVVVPFVACAVLIGWVVGKVSVTRWLGMHLLRDPEVETPVRALAAFAAGFAALTVGYMIPILGMIAWGTTGVLGLGAATLAVLAAYRREQPPAPTAPVGVAPPAPWRPHRCRPRHMRAPRQRPTQRRLRRRSRRQTPQPSRRRRFWRSRAHDSATGWRRSCWT